MDNFYQSLGYLIFGSRLKRLSEYFLSEINAVYKQQDIEFDASWFPAFYLLSQHQPVSIQELSETMMVSHSASSQLVSTLQKKGLVISEKSKDDARKQQIRLTANGEQLLQKLIPIWDAIVQVLQHRIENDPASKALLQVLAAAEEKLAVSPLAQDIVSQLNHNNQK
ncbi:MarR family winged helix-turn-helix transcriptional regulator [Pedobacter deserti]|uniref:MarR family winged helix-turn-helix transcriptional regulator n=1 Tax=Pedobacter deserti TaxID=2817382 RepID=UPI00210A8ED6|nr:MarR family winged helix-turn-helix transcriptional regulator [Pedobacter sp. SYSU D00382]